MLTILLVVVHFSPLKAQDDFSWWNDVNNWDGNTHWSNYIIFSPYYMGPNALPVPEGQKGLIRARGEFRTDAIQHFSRGDRTFNLEMHFYWPLLDNRVAIEFYGVPFETYKMDEQLILERRTRNKSGKGHAVGDFYFSTMIQLIKDKKFPDVVFRMAARTASGSGLADARNTDAPGYFFDVSFGRTIQLREQTKLRWYGMAGFYSWQMNLPNSRQNDAIIFGLGADISWGSWFLNNAIEGYSGYIGDEMIIVANPDQLIPFKDRPVLYRVEAGKTFSKIKLSIGYQLALKDFYYDHIKVSASYLFP